MAGDSMFSVCHILLTCLPWSLVDMLVNGDFSVLEHCNSKAGNMVVTGKLET